MANFSVGGRRINYERRGSGEPLLMIMGMSGSWLHWGEPLLENLGRNRELILYDHRGIGAGEHLTEPFSIAELADDAAALLDGLGIERADVVGISMGGMVAQELVLRHPGRVRGLVIGCTFAGGEGTDYGDPSIWQRAAEAAASGDRELSIRILWEANVSAEFAGDDDAYARLRAATMARPVPTSLILLQFQAILGHDAHSRLGEIAAPTLVIHGRADRVVPYSNSAALAEGIPGARLETLAGVGHLFFWELPERSAELIREHLDVAASASA